MFMTLSTDLLFFLAGNMTVSSSLTTPIREILCMDRSWLIRLLAI